MDPYYIVGYVRNQSTALAYAHPVTSAMLTSHDWMGDELKSASPCQMDTITHHDAIMSILKQPVGRTYAFGLCDYDEATRFLKTAKHVLAQFTDDKVDSIINADRKPEPPQHPPQPTMQHHAGLVVTDEDIQAALRQKENEEVEEEDDTSSAIQRAKAANDAAIAYVEQTHRITIRRLVVAFVWGVATGCVICGVVAQLVWG